MLLRGPGSPWARMQRARRDLDRIVYGEIARRRAEGADGDDVLSMLIQARDEDCDGFTDREPAIRPCTSCSAVATTSPSSTLSFWCTSSRGIRMRRRGSATSRTGAGRSRAHR